MDGILLVIPAFDEVRTIADVVRRAQAHGPVLVVDDGSSDGTAAAARGAGAAVIGHARRRGKGAALKTAFAEARRRGVSRVVTLDADGQHDAGDIPAMLAASAAAPDTVIVGVRLDREALQRDRALAMELASFWVNWISGVAIADTQSGFRVYPATVLEDVPCRGGRFVFETDVLVEALRRGWQVREVPVRTVPHASRASRFNPVRDGVAIAGYLAAAAVARWGIECAAAVREVAMVFSRGRRMARHGRILERTAVFAGTPGWSAAVGMAAVDAARTRLTGWGRHPRLRRARRAAVATLATPPALAVVALTSITPRMVPDGLARAVRTVYDVRALPALHEAPPATRDGESRTWAAVPR